PQYQVPVETEAQLRVETVSLIPRPPPEEGRRLEHVVESLRERRSIDHDMSRAERRESSVLLPKAQSVADIEALFRERGGGAGHGPERVAPVIVVRVQPGDDLARAAADALVDGGGLAAVGCALPMGETGCERPEDLHA